jgi:hypothetical protein
VTTSSRNWDRSPETDADSRFHELRNSGYTGPIDHDGNKVDDVDAWADAQLGRQ